MTLASPALLAVGLLVAAALGFRAVAVSRRRAAALAAAGGTSLGSSIIASLSAITGKAISIERNGTVPSIGYWPSATIVIFSDGQDEGAARDTAAATAAAEKAGVRIDTVGVGTAAATT